MSNPVAISIKSNKEKLTNTIQNYYLYNIDETFDENEAKEKKIIERIKESNLVIIDHFIYKNKDEKYLFIGFHKTIIIIKDSSNELLQPFFANNTRLRRYNRNLKPNFYDE